MENRVTSVYLSSILYSIIKNMDYEYVEYLMDNICSENEKGTTAFALSKSKLVYLCLHSQVREQVPDLKLIFRGTQFKLNDKVMQIVNNYEKEVFNGDSGLIEYINIKDRTLTVNYDGRRILYNEKELEEFILAYVITIHKSQGSEYPIVVMSITTEHYVMLYRNLLYTRITRAKKVMVIIGNKQALNYAIDNVDVEIRNTYLCERLMNQID